MPFIYDQTQIEWPEDGSDPLPPRVGDFVYLPPPEFTGVKEPVRFTLDLPAEAIAPPPAVVSQPPAAPTPVRRGILDRLFRRQQPSASPPPNRMTVQERMREQELQQERRRQLLFRAVVPPLRTAGVRRAYCRYDGGNDEGFSWLDHYESESGNRLDLDGLAERLLELDVHDGLRAAGFGAHLTATSKDQKSAELRGFISGWLTDEWATLLLGRGFGTGEYSMYGAFEVDLEACTIMDDPNAAPQVHNLTIME